MHPAVHPKTAVQRCSRDPYSRPQGLNTSNVEEPLPFLLSFGSFTAGSVCLHLGSKLDRLHVPPISGRTKYYLVLVGRVNTLCAMRETGGGCKSKEMGTT